MERDVLEIMELELKYCERCGGLWLREKGSQKVYCAMCLPKMAEMARGQAKGRPRLPSGVKIEGRCAELLAVVMEGGEA